MAKWGHLGRAGWRWRRELQHKVDALEKCVTGLQAAVERLTTILEKERVKRKPNPPGASTAA